MRCPFLWFPCMSQATLATLATQNLRAQPRLLLSAPFPFLLTLQKQNFNFLYGGLTITYQKRVKGMHPSAQGTSSELAWPWPDRSKEEDKRSIPCWFARCRSKVQCKYSRRKYKANTGRVVVLVRPWTLEPAGQLRKASADSRHLIQCAACTQYRHALHMEGW